MAFIKKFIERNREYCWQPKFYVYKWNCYTNLWKQFSLIMGWHVMEVSVDLAVGASSFFFKQYLMLSVNLFHSSYHYFFHFSMLVANFHTKYYRSLYIYLSRRYSMINFYTVNEKRYHLNIWASKYIDFRSNH